MRPLTVVKLGGSQAVSPLLGSWLAAAAGAAGQVVLVPGGGAFADAVRRAQPQMGFDDRAAHVMALLAMAQYAIALAGIGPAALVVVESRAEIGRAAAARRVPVWSPVAMLRDAPDVPASWAVTSDSLALWLARAINAPRVLMVKPRTAPSGATVPRLVADGLLDAAFPDFLARYAGTVFLAGPGDVPDAALDPGRLPGICIRALV